MSDKTKQLILKTLVIVDLILFSIIFPGMFIIASVFTVEENSFITFGNIILNSFFGVGILFMILLPIFGGLKLPKVKADKLPLSFDSYEQFYNFLKGQLEKEKYQTQKTMFFSSGGEVTVFTKPEKWGKLKCFTIVRINELSEESIDKSNDCVTSILTNYYGGKKITDSVNMITVFCVERITPAFRKLLNSNVQQGIKNGRFLVGVSFGGKNIYISKQKDGFAITKYKRLRRTFYDIMGDKMGGNNKKG